MPRLYLIEKGEKEENPPETSAAVRLFFNGKEVVYRGVCQSLKTQLRSLFKMP